MWPFSYAVVSSSTSITRIAGSSRRSASQSVSTSVSGWAYSAIAKEFRSDAKAQTPFDSVDVVRDMTAVTQARDPLQGPGEKAGELRPANVYALEVHEPGAVPFGDGGHPPLDEPVEMAQHEHGPMHGVEGLEHRAHVDVSTEVGRGDGSLEGHRIDRYRTLGARRPQRLAHGDSASPGTQSHGVSQAGEVSEDGHERLLGGVLTGVEGDGAADAADVRSDLAEERVHGGSVSALGAPDELLHVSRSSGTD